MKFHLTDTTENYPTLRLESVHGGWECGIVPMLFGCRIRLSRVDAGDCLLDYCAGAEPSMQLRILTMVVAILKKVPEDTPDHVVHDMFPRYQVKPIFKDQECWTALNAAYQKAKMPGDAVCPDWLKERMRRLREMPSPTIEEVERQFAASARVRQEMM